MSAATATAAFILTGTTSKKPKAEEAAAKAIEELQLNTTQTVSVSLEEKTTIVLPSLPETPALQILERIAMKRHMPVSEEYLKTAIKTLKKLIYFSIRSLMRGESITYHSFQGTSLIALLAALVVHSLGGWQLAVAMHKLCIQFSLVNVVGTMIPVIATEAFEVTTSQEKIKSFGLTGLFAALLAYRHGLKVERIGAGIGSAMTTAALTLKALETMGIATEGKGGFILPSSGGTIAGTIIALAGEKIKWEGGDKRVTNWACSISILLWLATAYLKQQDSEDQSVSDLLSTWAAISVLSGLMAATIAQFLPRQDQQN